ncbi:MAG: hypothetical protein K0R08_388 [Solimicrobium sp.]|jgi:hypothetical protein|nr:hypothetical protein [Solimicrobium sp.]
MNFTANINKSNNSVIGTTNTTSTTDTTSTTTTTDTISTARTVIDSTEYKKLLRRESSFELDRGEPKPVSVITLRTIIRGLFAPDTKDPVEYGAAHFNDLGKGFLWSIGEAFSMKRESNAVLSCEKTLRKHTKISLGKEELLIVQYRSIANALCVAHRAPLYMGNSIIIHDGRNDEQGRALSLTTVGRSTLEFQFGNETEVVEITIEDLKRKLARYVTADLCEQPPDTTNSEPPMEMSGKLILPELQQELDVELKTKSDLQSQQAVAQQAEVEQVIQTLQEELLKQKNDYPKLYGQWPREMQLRERIPQRTPVKHPRNQPAGKLQPQSSSRDSQRHEKLQSNQELSIQLKTAARRTTY